MNVSWVVLEITYRFFPRSIETHYPNRAYKSLTDIGAAAYVSGALGAYFNKQSGIKDRVNVEVWTGIIGISADLMPWVGR